MSRLAVKTDTISTNPTSVQNNKKAILSQRWPHDASYIWMPWKILGSPWLRPRLLFPKLFMGFCCDQSHESAYKIWSS